MFCSVDGDHRDLHVLTHSFPTRRSPDLASDLHEAGTGPVSLLHRLRGAALGYSKWLVALVQVAHKEAAPGRDLADFVEAHHGRSKSTQVAVGLAALVPTPAPNVVIHDVPVPVIAGSREPSLESTYPKHTGPRDVHDFGKIDHIQVHLHNTH